MSSGTSVDHACFGAARHPAFRRRERGLRLEHGTLEPVASRFEGAAQAANPQGPISTEGRRARVGRREAQGRNDP